MASNLQRIAEQLANVGSTVPPRGMTVRNFSWPGISDPATWQGIRAVEQQWLQQQRKFVPPTDPIARSLAHIPEVKLPALQEPEWVNNIVDQSRGIGSFLAQLNAMVERVAQSMAAPLAGIAQISQAMAPPVQGWVQLVENLPNSWNFGGFWENLRPILNGIQILIEEGQAGREVLRASEFGFAEHFWGIFYVRAFAHIPERVRPMVVTNKLVQYTTSELFVERLKDLLCESQLLNKRWHIVEAICDAHATKNYILAVPAALAQIEGILVDLMFLKDLVRRENGKFYLVDESGNYKRRKDGKRLGPVTLGPAITYAQLGDHPNLTATSEFIANTLIQRRNAVLHGRDLGYAKAKFSVQALLLLTVLSKAASELESGEVILPSSP